jgi:hypothetical protein
MSGIIGGRKPAPVEMTPTEVANDQNSRHSTRCPSC